MLKESIKKGRLLIVTFKYQLKLNNITNAGRYDNTMSTEYINIYIYFYIEACSAWH